MFLFFNRRYLVPSKQPDDVILSTIELKLSSCSISQATVCATAVLHSGCGSSCYFGADTL